jgi:hypothetical protein
MLYIGKSLSISTTELSCTLLALEENVFLNSAAIVGHELKCELENRLVWLSE